MHSFYLDAIRKFEGYTPQASWDYAQFSNGYGTKALYPGEVIDKAEAERRFKAEVGDARRIVEKHAPHVDEGTKAALTSLTYNAGTAWISSGLGDAVRRGDLDQVREIFQKYNKAGGEVLPGLVSRRAQEALWIGNPDIAAGAAASQSPVVTAALDMAAAAESVETVSAPRVDAPLQQVPQTHAFRDREPAQMLLQALADTPPFADSPRVTPAEPSVRVALSHLSLEGLLRASGVEPSWQGAEVQALELTRLMRLDSGLEVRSSREQSGDERRTTRS